MSIDGQIKMMQEDTARNYESAIRAAEVLKGTQDEDRILHLHNVVSFYRLQSENYHDIEISLMQLKRIMEIVSNAEKLIAEHYGVVIAEGYSDIMDQIREVLTWHTVTKTDTTV